MTREDLGLGQGLCKVYDVHLLDCKPLQQNRPARTHTVHNLNKKVTVIRYSARYNYPGVVKVCGKIFGAPPPPGQPKVRLSNSDVWQW